MSREDISLHDKYNLEKSTVLLNGTQALVRLMLMQAARDKAAGHKTAGFVSGYRGSPLGSVDQQMILAKDALSSADVKFQPGLNEDLAVTSIWGTQQIGLHEEGTKDGVFGLWYGKGPGVDRSGDAMRHANMAGTAKLGGVLMAMGDDHTGESSTTCHQSDWAMMDAYIPVLSPAGVQEILDFGLYGFALSRFSGLWTGLKVMKDTIEVTSVVDGGLNKKNFRLPEFDLPEGGLNIRGQDHWIAQEARMIDQKRFAAEAFANANKIDNRMWGKPGAKIGFVAAGKNWLDLVHALNLLGLDEEKSTEMGISTYKIGQTFPMDMKSFHDWAEGLELIVVVEEKRKLIEIQIKEAIFDDRRGRRVYGWYKGGAGQMHQEELFPTRMALDPVMIAEKIGQILIEEDRGTEEIHGRLASLAKTRAADNAAEIASRTPYFCSGCPHNTSTKVPEGSRAYAGIGCHIMSLWMDRDTYGYTHMGAEGANWIGEAPFSKRDHVFQNLGDGTYNHSGNLAIRAAIAANVNITYKILFNDAVAMTGGQPNDGGLSADRIARELIAMGLKDVAIVFDEKEEPIRSQFPPEVEWHSRDKLPEVQERFRKIDGVSAIIFIQTCAAEKRRKRKRGQFPDPDKRIFINTDICEGCGDCGVQSNCVSIVPVETEFGRKRAIEQSGCNKDYSCVNGFCPSFVTVEGGKLKKQPSQKIDVGALSHPDLPAIEGTHNVVITGVGGTGVVTIGALLAMAAHIDGKGAGVMEMAGLAQKGGAVHVHCRLANTPEDISAIRVATGEAHTLIGGDLVVSAGAKTIGLMSSGTTKGVVNNHEIITGEFTRDREFRIPGDRLSLSLRARLREDIHLFDASELSTRVLGDAIFSNMIVFGASWQLAQIPLSLDSINQAIRLNGAKVDENLRAFELGRWAADNPKKASDLLASKSVDPSSNSFEDRFRKRKTHLRDYQSEKLADRYSSMVGSTDIPKLREALMLGYHKVLAYKDEYEVARLLAKTRAKAERVFEGDIRIGFQLAPPLLSPNGPDGRPRKRVFGGSFERVWPMLAKLKILRGTVFDPFRFTKDRRLERRLIKQYEKDMSEVLGNPSRNLEAAIELAELPLQIRGFGPVKEVSAAAAIARRDVLLEAFRAGAKSATMAAE